MGAPSSRADVTYGNLEKNIFRPPAKTRRSGDPQIYRSRIHRDHRVYRSGKLGDEQSIRKHLRYEFIDTIVAMVAGWAINSAMIIMAAAVFFSGHTVVSELSQAEETLRPLLGNNAAFIFAAALLFAGVSSSISSALAAGSIFAGYFGEPLDVADSHSRLGIVISIGLAALAVFFSPIPSSA